MVVQPGSNDHHLVLRLTIQDSVVAGPLTIKALGKLGPEAPESVAAVMSKILLESKSGEERNQAAFALMKMAPASKPAVGALSHALNDDNLHVRHNAVQALVRLKLDARPAMPELFKALERGRNFRRMIFRRILPKVFATWLSPRCG